jgi:hypothetical protein
LLLDREWPLGQLEVAKYVDRVLLQRSTVGGLQWFEQSQGELAAVESPRPNRASIHESEWPDQAVAGDEATMRPDDVVARLPTTQNRVEGPEQQR